MATDVATAALHAEINLLRSRVAELEQTVAAYERTGDLSQHQLAAIEAALDGIAILDQQGTYVYMNNAHAQVHGYDHPSELLGKDWTVVVPDDMIEKYQQEYMPVLYRDGCWRGEVPSKRRDGSLHLTDVSLRVLDNGGLVCVLRDLSEREQAQSELHRSKLLLQMVMDNIPQAIFWKDRNLTFLGCNRRFANDMGFESPEEIIGKNDYDLTTKEFADMYRADDLRVMETGEAKIGFEEPIETVNGPGWLRTSKVPLRDSRGRVVAVLGMYEDITERKQVEEERARFQEEIIQAQAAALAELSTPLIPISEQIMVMPLVGSMDSRRAQQVLDVLLHGVAQNGVSLAIIDITGVPVVDTQVANGLLRAAQAVKLLGANVILTGIRPEVAQTLVGLGTNLDGIITRSTLQSGIAYATSLRQGK